MRFKFTPLQIASFIGLLALLAGFYVENFRTSNYFVAFLVIWNFLPSAIESAMRRSEIRQRGSLALSEAYSRCNGIYVMATLASNVEIYSKAYQDLEAWLTSTQKVIQEYFSVDAAETFMVIGNETAGTMVLQLRQLRLYNEANRQVVLQWLEVYSARLHELMQQAPAIKRSWWLTPLTGPTSPSAPRTASSPSPK